MKIILIISALLGAGITGFAQPKLSKDNIDEVLKAMTLQEKAVFVTGTGWGGTMSGAGVPTGSAGLLPGAAGTTQAIERLGIPATVLADGPAGLRINPTRPGDPNTYYCTGFPVGTVLACSWNTEAVEQITTAMGNEVLEYGADVLLAPGQNLHRNPLCGRNFEYFSEDPVLSGKIAAAYVRGIQSNGVGVSLKHFAFNNQETLRMTVDARVNQRAARELYLKNFEIAVKESDPWTIMSSYNRIQGEFTQESKDLLTTILRDEWGFKGIVMTDWTGKRNTPAQIMAGNDLMEPGQTNESDELVAAVKAGTLDEADLDICVRRILEYVVKTPAFRNYKFSSKPDLNAHAALVRKSAAEGMVLLKNDASTLPMAASGKVALFGLRGYRTVAGGTGSGNVNKKYVSNICEGLASAGFALDEAVANYYRKVYELDAAKSSADGGTAGITLGETVIPEVEMSAAAIKAAAKNDDAAIVVIGRNAGEGSDRDITDFEISSIERDLLYNVTNEFHKLGKRVVVVLNIGGVIETASWKGMPDAILLAWTPGQEAGNSIADVLTGKSYPSGKLSMTFPVNYFDHPSSLNFPYETQSSSSASGLSAMVDPGMGEIDEAVAALFGMNKSTEPRKDFEYSNYEEGIWVGYRYFDTARKEVSYPFGYGLSYTTFEYSAPSAKVAKDGSVQVSITVKNTGKTAGKEAVQVYVSAPEAGLVKPEKELKAFAKTRELKPGESQTLTMTIDPYSLASFNEATSSWETAAGTYTAKIAASVDDIKASVTFKQAKAQSWKTNNVLAPKVTINEIAVK